MRGDDDPHAPHYEAEPVVCNACAEREMAQRSARQDNDGKGMEGWFWTVGQRSNGRG